MSAAHTGAPPATEPMTEPILAATGLHKRFGGVRAVQDISLAVPRGTVFAVIGPNGAGKSTLMNLLAGNLAPDEGRLALGGVDITGSAPWDRARLGLARTFQKIRLFRQSSVLENVLAGMHQHRRTSLARLIWPGRAARAADAAARESALALLDRVGLAGAAGERAGALAYGSQRMLEIARALATRPRVFLLDEPAAGLNPAESEFLLERLAELRQEGMTLVLVEHNMDLVMRISDQVFVMDHGEPLFQGTPAEVQRHPEVIAAYLGTELAPGAEGGAGG